MKKVIIATICLILLSCEYESNTNISSNKLAEASYRKGWWDGVDRALNHNWRNGKDAYDTFIVDSVKFREILK